MENIREKFAESFAKINDIKREMAKVIVGQEDAINNILICLYSGGHILLESMPGLAKTRMAVTLSKIIGVDSKRIQFTPDLTPSDVTGYELPIFGTQEFFTRLGPIVTVLVIGDEVNRTPEKTQAALMEAMQERQVTIAGATHPLDALFTFIGTRNPIETGGTFSLAEAILDRFMLNIFIDYPSLEDEEKISITGDGLSELRQIARSEDILPVRNYLLTNEFLPEGHPMAKYVSRLIQATRPKTNQAGLIFSKKDFNFYASQIKYSLASPRATKAFLRALFVYSFGILKENLILPEHVKVLAKSLLRHRLILQPEIEYGGGESGEIIEGLIDWLLDRVPIY